MKSPSTLRKEVGKKAIAGKRRAKATPEDALAASPVVREILALTRAKGFSQYLSKLLVELCQIDTTPNPDVAKMREAEGKCFAIIERELGQLPHAGAKTDRRPINPAIRNHPNYSLLHFTKTPTRPAGLPPEEVYADRANLVYVIPGSAPGGKGCSVALNAHVDVVAPYFSPSIRGNTVVGRGACDDKGPVVGLIAAFKVLASVMAKRGLTWNRNVLGLFVVEEETGGNGSLSLATDRELKSLYDSVLVSECTGLKLHPSNRGAVWYRAKLTPPADSSAFEMFAFVNEEMEKEGAAIRSESRHALFPQRPVQTCHGIIGAFGEHPSRICGQVRFTISFERTPGQPIEDLVRDCLQAGLESYVGLYGDKTKVVDPATSKPMVAYHYELNKTPDGFEIDVYGAPGHMGSIRERDGAITKTAHLVRSLCFSKARLEKTGGSMHLALSQEPSREPQALIIEGGQGFVPTHTIEEVMQRLREAAQRGAENYLRRLGPRQGFGKVVEVTYEKLHNVAFDGDPESPAMKHALQAARVCGLPNQEPVLGWTVSCDARLFATEYPGMPVLTFGPGQLVHAHSDHEQIAIDEIRAAAEFLAIFLLLQTGTAAL